MEIETRIISSEFIKPSSPPPKSLQKHKLSFLDQSTPPLFLPTVYFYRSTPRISNLEKPKQLKKSLSETLTSFVENLYVDCNDGVVPFSEAEANCDISQVIYNPNPKDMDKFLPYKFDELRDFSIAVQFTYFRCGGVAVGLLVSHKIADARSSVLFANSWATVARTGNDGGAAYFSPVDNSPARGIVQEEVATRIFTFSADTIALLQKRYSSGGRRPSRVEALSVFIWTRFAASTRSRSRPDPKKIQYPVNIWARVDPALPDIFMLTTALVKGSGAVNGGGFVARLKEGESHLHFADEGEPVSFNFMSLCRSPLYEADFGWGEPVWVGSPGLARKKLAIFTDTKSGGGIEALIGLSKKDMKKFETDLELQIFIETNFGADLNIFPKLKSQL